ncbi:MAG: PKD domain-containing protein, partial [Alphaproteobacteria bacterium]
MATITVSSAAGLNAALAAASGGDIIELAAGSYGHVNISGLNTAAGVTIRSADPNARADLASLYITNSSNLTIEDVLVDFVPDQFTALWSPAVDIRASDSITIRNTEIDGGKAVNNLNGNVQGYYTGMGIQAIHGTTNLKVISSDIHGFDKGIRLDVDGLVVKNSEIHHTRSTPLGGTFSNAVIDGNHLHDIYPHNYGGAGDHGDFIKIQRLSGGASPLSNITITNNFFDQGKGHPILGILFDSSGNPTGFANVDISDNVFFNANALGMSLNNVHNSRIANNTLLDSRGDDLDQPGIYLAGGNSNIAIIDNIAGYVSAGGGTGITEQGTLLVQRTNPYGANFYGDLFVNALSLLPDIEDLRARPGGPLDGTGLGAALTHFDPSPQKLTAQILPVRDGAGLFLFDGRLSADKSGYLDAQNATFSWDFGNGKTGAGDSAVVSYDTPGFYKVVLTVSHGGRTDRSTSWVEVVDPLLLRLNGDGGTIADGSSYGVPVTSSVGVSLADGPWGKALRMGASSELRFDRHQADQLFNLDGFQ